ncbi:MAG TPA: tetratricopeptide repeat protein, partial [Ktedonobacteraceae bacterium]|nr:tetratricopeptide repeat protein [Ktedonobacteraceae bacterium]
MGRRLGLIIGVNHYQDTAFRPLQFAETDARAFAQWLVHARGGKWNPADVQLLLGQEVTRELVEPLLSQLCLAMASPDDLLLIYFAGHAFVDQVSGEGFLACSNTRYQQSGSGLHLLSLVSQVFARSPAAQILCILDCFQTGSVWNMRRGSAFDFKPLLGPTLQNGLQQLQGRLLYCSCRGTDTVPEVSEKNLGTFMYRLVMGAGGPATDPMSGQISLQQLHTFLLERLSEQHRPQVFGQESRPLVLVGEMPAFSRTGALNGAQPAGDINVQGDPFLDGPGPQYSHPASSQGGQATLATLEQNRIQQAQQMLSQARQMVQMQNFPQAMQLIEMTLQMNQNFVEALILKGQILGAMSQFDEALETVRKIVQLDPENALGWSMAAALLANVGQFPEAMSAADRSLSLDPTNTETISIKAMIREKLAERQADTGKRSRLIAPDNPYKENAASFFRGMGIQLAGLVLGIVGAAVLLLKPDLPIIIGFVLESVGLALLLVNAWRGAFLYGFFRVLSTLLFSLITVGIAGGLYVFKPAYNFLLARVAASFAMMMPLIF